MLLLTLAVAGTAGCMDGWRLEQSDVQIAPAVMHFDIAQRLAPPESRALYERTTAHSTDPPTRYEVVRTGNVQREGALADSNIADLAPYLAADDGSPQLPWPSSETERSAGLLIRFDPPAQYLPAMLDAGKTHHETVQVQIHNPAGKLLYTGNAERELRVEGYENVATSDMRYPDCVRVFTQTRIRVPWIARLTVSEYLWLAPNKGFVRRVQRLAGWVFLRYFEDVVEDRLIKIEMLPTHRGDDTATDPARGWSSAALYFCPSLPQPRIAGAIFEFADRSREPTTDPQP